MLTESAKYLKLTPKKKKKKKRVKGLPLVTSKLNWWMELYEYWELTVMFKKQV